MNQILKRMKSKTYWAAVGVAGMGFIEANTGMLQAMLGPYYPMAYVGISVLMMALRELTTKPVAEK